jgi:hypothetical protein
MPKDYFTTVYHQKAVRVLGTRDLYLRTVYCHVVNYTQSQGKWSGTFQEMENQIEISKSKICRSMNQLIEMGLVRKEDKHAFIAISNSSVADSNQNDADSNKSVANSNSPCTPLNKEETQVSDARMQAHDVPDFEVSFADFCAAYRRTCGPITMKQKDDAYEAWRKLNPRFKKALMAEFDKPNGLRKARADWQIADFAALKPKWLSGAEQDKLLREGKTICICLDIFSPVERRQPIEYEEAWRFELPCLRMEQMDARGRLIKRDHTANDEIELPLDPRLLIATNA